MRVKNLPMLMVGDFNIDARDSDVLTQYFMQNNLVQLIEEPTHIEGRIIDHMWVSKNLPKLELTLQYPYYTQHKSFIVKFQQI